MLRRFASPLILLLPLVWLFRRALFFGEVFAFRDTSFYYYPYYQFVQAKWAEGLPLWNPLDGIGQPLLADPTAAVLYPGKLCFVLPCSYELCFAIYLLVHAWLAGFGAFRLARQLRCQTLGAILAGLAFEMSGQVLFQYCNPIYLVGAAWLPWALLFFVRSQSGRGFREISKLSVVLSLMVFGGEPQMAMHCVMAMGLWWLLLVVRCFVGRAHIQAVASRSFKAIVFACVVALLLSAAQVLPTKAWSSQSDRSLVDAPRSIWEMVGRGSADPTALWKQPAVGSKHDEKIYGFSVGPWRWGELMLPNASGQFGPKSTRWLRAVPGEGRMWTPTLYLGLLTVGLAITRFRLLGGSLVASWLSWLTLLSMLAAMGEYGFGWLVEELRYQTDPESFGSSTLRREFGGVYWFLTVVVPGYVEFRYPAKWWTIASLGISLLAAKGWPLLWRKRKRVLQRTAVVAIVCGAVVLAGRFLVVESVSASRVFGPFDDRLATQHLLICLVHVIAVAVAVFLLSRKATWRTKRLLLTVCAVELAIAQQGIVYTAKSETLVASATPTTVYRDSKAFPQEFESSSSDERFRELREFEKQTLAGKHHLAAGLRHLNPICSLRDADYAAVLELQDAPDLLGRGQALEGDGRAWLVYDWIQFDGDDGLNSATALKERTEELLRPNGQLIDYRELATVESNETLPQPAGTGDGSCQVVDAGANRIEIQVSTPRPSLLVLRDQYSAGWQATIEKGGANDGRATTQPIYRTNRVMRGVFVAAGDSKVVFEYRSLEVRIGLAVSVLSWLTMAGWWTKAGWWTRSRA